MTDSDIIQRLGWPACHFVTSYCTIHDSWAVDNAALCPAVQRDCEMVRQGMSIADIP